MIRMVLALVLAAFTAAPIAALGSDVVMSRDTVTGHRYQVGRQDGHEAAFILGADLAYVDDSELLP